MMRIDRIGTEHGASIEQLDERRHDALPQRAHRRFHADLVDNDAIVIHAIGSRRRQARRLEVLDLGNEVGAVLWRACRGVCRCVCVCVCV